MGLAEETRRQVRAAGTEGGHLRLATTEQLAEQIAPPLLEAFVRRHPDVETTTLTVPSSALAELLLDRRADVVVGLAGADQSGSAGPPGPDTFEHIPFLRFQLVVVAARNCAGSGLDRLAGGRLHLPVGRLPKAHWLLGPGGLDPGTPGGAFLTRHGVGEADASVFPSTSAALGAAVAGEGCPSPCCTWSATNCATDRSPWSPSPVHRSTACCGPARCPVSGARRPPPRCAAS